MKNKKATCLRSVEFECRKCCRPNMENKETVHNDKCELLNILVFRKFYKSNGNCPTIILFS